MIFVLAVEVLTQMVLKTQEVDLMEGFKVSPGGSGFPILQFVDDTLILTKASVKEVKVVKNILIWFEACLGLKVNTSKTKIYQVNKVEGWELILYGWKCM